MNMDKINKDTILRTLKNSDQILLSSQKRLCLPIIKRIYKKMMNGLKFDDIKVCRTLIIDGHHRYVSSVLANIRLDAVKSSKTSATIKYDWIDIEFVNEEWDTEDKIQRLNQLDAEFNNITISKLIELTK